MFARMAFSYGRLTVLNIKYCYHKCTLRRLAFGYSKYYSVTDMLLTLHLPSFETAINNCRHSFMNM